MASGHGKSGSSSGGGDSKQKLFPWLVAQINSGKIPDLHWLNDEHTKFQIPWTHKGKQEWSEESGQIFKEYEKHTGRYQEGGKEIDYAKAKTRLRCALHKSLDFKLISNDCDTDNVRIYEIVQRQQPSRTSSQQQMSPQYSPDSPNPPPQRQAIIPLAVESETSDSLTTGQPEPPLSSDLQSLLASALVSDQAMSLSNISIDTHISDVQMLSVGVNSLGISGTQPTISAQPRQPIARAHGSEQHVGLQGLPVIDYSNSVTTGTHFVAGSCNDAETSVLQPTLSSSEFDLFQALDALDELCKIDESASVRQSNSSMQSPATFQTSSTLSQNEILADTSEILPPSAIYTQYVVGDQQPIYFNCSAVDIETSPTRCVQDQYAMTHTAGTCDQLQGETRGDLEETFPSFPVTYGFDDETFKL